MSKILHITNIELYEYLTNDKKSFIKLPALSNIFKINCITKTNANTRLFGTTLSNTVGKCFAVRTNLFIVGWGSQRYEYDDYEYNKDFEFNIESTSSKLLFNGTEYNISLSDLGNLYLFGLFADKLYASEANVSIKFFNIDDKIALVPCKLKNSIYPPNTWDSNIHYAGECGMWDKINQVFYGNENTEGSFSVSNKIDEIQINNSSIEYIAIAEDSVIYPKKVYFANANNTLKLVYERIELDSSYYQFYDYCAIGQTAFPQANFNPLVGDEFTYMNYNSRCGFGNSLMGFGAAKNSNSSSGFNLRVSGLDNVIISAKMFGNVFCDYSSDNVGEKGRIHLRCLEPDRLWLNIIFDNGAGTVNRTNISHMQNLTSVNPGGYLYCLNGREGWYYVNCDLGECELIGATSHYRFRPVKLKKKIYPWMSADGKTHQAGESGLYEEYTNTLFINSSYRAYNIAIVTITNYDNDNNTFPFPCEVGFVWEIPSRDGFTFTATDNNGNTYTDGDTITITQNITLTFVWTAVNNNE